MVCRSGKFWQSITRNSVVLLVVGLAAGLTIGWFLGTRYGVEKIALSPATSMTYTALSNDELKLRSAQLVTAMRALARSYYDEENRMRATADEQSGKTDSVTERERLRQAWLADSSKLHDRMMDRYIAEYWADALLLRQAIVTKVGGAPGAQNPMLFQHPTNILGIEQVANALDLLGKSLPGKAAQ